MNRFQRLIWWIQSSGLVWPIYQRIFMPWPPRGMKYKTERIVHPDGRILYLRTPVDDE